jgi:regulator of ribonuclease activity A
LRVVAPMFRSVTVGDPTFSGQIVTLKLFEDNSLVRERSQKTARARCWSSMAAARMRCALVGDQLAILAHKNGWEGIVVYGCIRDSGDIGQIDIGVRALTTHPMKSIKKERRRPRSGGNLRRHHLQSRRASLRGRRRCAGFEQGADLARAHGP